MITFHSFGLLTLNIKTMKHFSFFLLITILLSSCSEETIENPQGNNESIGVRGYLFTSKSNIEHFKKEGQLKSFLNDYETILKNYNPDLETIECQDGTGYLNNGSGDGDDGNNGDGDTGIKPVGSDGNGNYYDSNDTTSNRHHFNTLVGDLFISNNGDSDAIRRVALWGDTYCIPNYPESQYDYINVIIENSVNTNWRNAVITAIEELNNAINFNPNNSGDPFDPDFDDPGTALSGSSPSIYFRLATTENENDYGNITVFFDHLVIDGAVAAGQIGKFAEVFNTGIYKHTIGNWLKIDPDFANYPHQLAITAVIHEMGHNLGFKHSNVSDVNIEGTTLTTDSFMRNTVNGPWNTNGFSDEDYVALDLIFHVDSDHWFEDCLSDPIID